MFGPRHKEFQMMILAQYFRFTALCQIKGSFVDSNIQNHCYDLFLDKESRFLLMQKVGIYLPNISASGMMTKGQFYAEYDWFEFKVFLLLDWLPY